jgi:hypothetical protein
MDLTVEILFDRQKQLLQLKDKMKMKILSMEAEYRDDHKV